MIAKLSIACLLLALAAASTFASPTKGLREDANLPPAKSEALSSLEQKQEEPIQQAEHKRDEPIKQAEQKRDETQQVEEVRDESSWQQKQEEIQRPLPNNWQLENSKAIKSTEEKRDESHLKTRLSATAHAQPQHLTREFHQAVPMYQPNYNLRCEFGEFCLPSGRRYPSSYRPSYPIRPRYAPAPYYQQRPAMPLASPAYYYQAPPVYAQPLPFAIMNNRY